MLSLVEHEKSYKTPGSAQSLYVYVYAQSDLSLYRSHMANFWKSNICLGYILSNKDSKKLYDLADLLSEIEALKLDPKYSSILGYYDASSGVIPIVNKLPFNLREMWVTHA